MPSGERGDVLASKVRELVEQRGERFSLALAELGEAVVGRETPFRPLSKDDLRAWNPVGALSVNQMADDHVRAPRLRSLRRISPLRSESRKHRAQRARCPLENLDAISQVEVHVVALQQQSISR